MAGVVSIVVVVLLVMGVVAVTRSWRRVGRLPDPATFLAVHDLPATEATMRMAHAFLWRQRWFRLLGAWLGFAAVIASRLWTPGRAALGINHLCGIVVGSALGIAWAARPPRRALGPNRTASLAPRTVAAAIPARARQVEAVAAALVVTALAVVAGIAFASDGRGLGWRLAVTAAAVVAGLVATRVLQRRVVEAARPVVSPELGAVDDACRASTVQSLHHALVAGVCCATLAVVGGVGMLANRVEVRFDGVLEYRGAPSGQWWTAEPTPDGGVLVHTVEPGDPEQHVTIRRPPGVTAEAARDRWVVTGTSGGQRTLGVFIGGWFGLFVTLALCGATVAEWSRMRRAPYQPLVRDSSVPVTATGPPA